MLSDPGDRWRHLKAPRRGRDSTPPCGRPPRDRPAAPSETSTSTSSNGLSRQLLHLLHRQLQTCTRRLPAGGPPLCLLDRDRSEMSSEMLGRPSFLLENLECSSRFLGRRAAQRGTCEARRERRLGTLEGGRETRKRSRARDQVGGLLRGVVGARPASQPSVRLRAAPGPTDPGAFFFGLAAPPPLSSWDVSLRKLRKGGGRRYERGQFWRHGVARAPGP